MNESPIEENFLRETRGHQKDLETDFLFDTRKIISAYEKYSLKLSSVEVTPLSENVADSLQLPPQTPNLIAAPEGSDSYVFKRDVSRSNVPVRILYLQNVFLSFDMKNFGNPEFYFFNHAGKLIDGLFFGAKPFIDPEPENLTHPAVLIDDFFPKPNICHFVFDKFPRWHIASKKGAERRPIAFNSFSYMSDIFSLFDTSPFVLTEKKRRGTLFFKDIAVFTNSFHHPGHPANFGHIFWKEAVQSIAAQAPRSTADPQRLMLSRANTLPRNIVNSAEVDSVLNEFGVTKVDPADMDTSDQIAMFASCELLVGVHGAGMTNLAFMPTGGDVLELMPPLCGTAAYWIGANVFGHHYSAITCHDPEFGKVDQNNIQHSAKNNRRDVVVPVDELYAALEQT